MTFITQLNIKKNNINLICKIDSSLVVLIKMAEVTKGNP